MIRLRRAPMKQSAPLRRGNKFGAKRVFKLGRWFDSTSEGDRGEQLAEMQKRGLIRDLRFQVKYDHTCNGVWIESWTVDFVYQARDPRDRKCWSPELTVEDWKFAGKGVDPTTLNRKMRWMKAEHGIIVRITTVDDYARDSVILRSVA